MTASTGIITTVAGNGTAGYSGDGGPATSAELNSPAGVALDSSGNIYIADTSNSRIRKVTVSTGVITTLAGDGTAGYSGDGGSATSAELYFPFAWQQIQGTTCISRISITAASAWSRSPAAPSAPPPETAPVATAVMVERLSARS